MVAGAVAVPATLAIVGFAPAGIAAGEYLTCSSLQPSLMKACTGSIAAGIHSGIGDSTTSLRCTSSLRGLIGNVAAGTLFAALQSAGTAPLVTGLVGGATAAGGIAVTYVARFFRRR